MNAAVHCKIIHDESSSVEYYETYFLSPTQARDNLQAIRFDDVSHLKLFRSKDFEHHAPLP